MGDFLYGQPDGRKLLGPSQNFLVLQRERNRQKKVEPAAQRSLKDRTRCTSSASKRRYDDVGVQHNPHIAGNMRLAPPIFNPVLRP